MLDPSHHSLPFTASLLGSTHRHGNPSRPGPPLLPSSGPVPDRPQGQGWPGSSRLSWGRCNWPRCLYPNHPTTWAVADSEGNWMFLFAQDSGNSHRLLLPGCGYQTQNIQVQTYLITSPTHHCGCLPPLLLTLSCLDGSTLSMAHGLAYTVLYSHQPNPDLIVFWTIISVILKICRSVCICVCIHSEKRKAYTLA